MKNTYRHMCNFFPEIKLQTWLLFTSNYFNIYLKRWGGAGSYVTTVE